MEKKRSKCKTQNLLKGYWKSQTCQVLRTRPQIYASSTSVKMTPDNWSGDDLPTTDPSLRCPTPVTRCYHWHWCQSCTVCCGHERFLAVFGLFFFFNLNTKFGVGQGMCLIGWLYITWPDLCCKGGWKRQYLAFSACIVERVLFVSSSCIRRAIWQIYYLDRKWAVHTGCQSVKC